MAQYHNSRNYRRDEQRNVNEVVFRDGMPVTYSSRQERGGKRPEGGYNKGGKSFNRGNDRRGAEQKPYYKDGEQKPYYKKRAATTAPRRKIIIRQSARKPHIRPAISRRRTRRRRTRSRMSCPTL